MSGQDIIQVSPQVLNTWQVPLDLGKMSPYALEGLDQAEIANDDVQHGGEQVLGDDTEEASDAGLCVAQPARRPEMCDGARGEALYVGGGTLCLDGPVEVRCVGDAGFEALLRGAGNL